MNLDIANLVISMGDNSIHKSWIEVFSALLTPTIAILGVFIAYNQCKIAEVNKRHRLFEERYEHLYRPVLEQIKKINTINNQNLDLSEKLKQVENILNSFYEDFYKYKFLISEFDEKRLSEVYNAIIKFYEIPLDVKKQQKEIYIRILITLYYLQNIEEILSSYLRVEQLNFINLYNFIGSILSYIVIFFLPVKCQENLLINGRQYKVIQKFSALFEKANANAEIEQKKYDTEYRGANQWHLTDP